MDSIAVIGAAALLCAPVAFAAITVTEARRVFRFLRRGVRVAGEVIGEELHGVGTRAPYPVVRFLDGSGVFRQFRSLISKRRKAFIHPKTVVVIYLPESPEQAELFSEFHLYKHLIGMVVVFVVSIVIAIFALPMFFE